MYIQVHVHMYITCTVQYMYMYLSNNFQLGGMFQSRTVLSSDTDASLEQSWLNRSENITPCVK